MAGVQVGRVTAISFDSKAYQARVTLTIRTQYDMIPQDTSASIFTAGLLGEQYVSLLPGGDEKVLKEGSTLQLTQSAVVLEEVIGQFLYSQRDEGKKGDKSF
jgi:phospholipid/cholesterol/gamma-HCH transport system substrate-binding protein